MAKKTVVFLSLAYSPSIGGAEKQAQLLAESWARAGQSVLVVTRRLPQLPSEEILNDVRVLRIRSVWLPGLAWVSFCVSALWHLWPMRVDISCIVGIMLNPGTIPGAVLARCCRIPFILRPSAGGYGGNLQTLARSRGGKLKQSFLMHAASYVVAMNQEVADEVAAAGIPAIKRRIIPNGVDMQMFTPASADLRAQRRRALGVGDSSPVVLFVGRLEKVKNLDGLLRAWKEIIVAVPEARLLLVGDGSERQSLEKNIQQENLTASVRLEGQKKDLAMYYQAADIFILPSHREGVSNAFLEAMASGLAPVASQVGGNREILAEFAPELLIDPASPGDWSKILVPLLQDRNRSQDIGRRARAFIEGRFSAEVMKRQYGELLTNVTQPYFRQAFPILAYHRVLEKPVYGIDTSLQEFSEQVAWLAAEGYRSISLTEFYRLWKDGSAFPAKSFVMTFDDGHRELYEHAFPILKKAGFTATVFVNTGLLGKTFWIGGRRPSPVRWLESPPADYNPNSSEWRTYQFMSWTQVDDLRRNGFEIESHAVTHPFLTDLAPADLERELRDSKRTLEEKFGAPVNFFCYPSGNVNERVQAAVRSAGYLGAVRSPAHNELFFYWDNPMLFERIGIWEKTPLWKFKALVTGRYTRFRQKLPSWAWHSSRLIFRGVRGAPLS